MKLLKPFAAAECADGYARANSGRARRYNRVAEVKFMFSGVIDKI